MVIQYMLPLKVIWRPSIVLFREEKKKKRVSFKLLARDQWIFLFISFPCLDSGFFFFFGQICGYYTVGKHSILPIVSGSVQEFIKIKKKEVYENNSRRLFKLMMRLIELCNPYVLLTATYVKYIYICTCVYICFLNWLVILITPFPLVVYLKSLTWKDLQM